LFAPVIPALISANVIPAFRPNSIIRARASSSPAKASAIDLPSAIPFLAAAIALYAFSQIVTVSSAVIYSAPSISCNALAAESPNFAQIEEISLSRSELYFDNSENKVVQSNFLPAF
jgi:hypothetical protein